MFIDYSFLEKKQNVLFVTIAIVSIYLGVAYLHPSNNNWLMSSDFSIWNAIQFILIDQIAIEYLSFYIIFKVAIKYTSLFNLGVLPEHKISHIFFLLKFIPLALVVYFFFSPITLSVRFVYHIIQGKIELAELSDIYFSDYFFINIKLYFSYLLPVFLSIFFIALYALFKSRTVNSNSKLRIKRIQVKSDLGEVILDQDNIVYFQLVNRKCEVITKTSKFYLNKTINDVEKKLNENDFARISRSVIINLNYLDSYAHWENEKYIVRMKNSAEFIMSRDRLNQIKEKLL